MRDPFRIQLHLNSIPVEEVDISTESRHTLYSILRGLQELFPHRKEITNLIVKSFCKNVKSTRGAPGMTGWQILVMIALRLHKDCSFDTLEVEFNENKIVRAMLELDADDDFRFSSKTLSENFRKLSPEMLETCNEFVLGKAMTRLNDDGKTVRSDSFACQTNIHYPTDQYLLYDAVRKVLELGHRFFGSNNSVWRQSKHLIKGMKRDVRKVSLSKRGGGKDKAKRIKKAYKKILSRASHVMSMTSEIIMPTNENVIVEKHSHFFSYTELLEKAFSLTWRRTQEGEKIESAEKILSIFEPHTEWINRGKFPNPVEFGHRVVVSQSLSGMIVDYKVMDNGETDRSEVKNLISRLKEKFGKLKVCSLDKGCWYADIYKDSADSIDKLVIAKKGKPSKESSKKEHEEDFIKYRQWRSGVESLISSLARSNGLGKCKDRGELAYKRWIGAGILSRNLITFGTALLEEDKKRNTNIAS